MGSFGSTTSVNYAFFGLIAWLLTAEFIGGGVVGGLVEMRLAVLLADQHATLNQLFAGAIVVVAPYVLCCSARTFVM